MIRLHLMIILTLLFNLAIFLLSACNQCPVDQMQRNLLFDDSYRPTLSLNQRIHTLAGLHHALVVNDVFGLLLKSRLNKKIGEFVSLRRVIISSIELKLFDSHGFSQLAGALDHFEFFKHL